MLRALLITGLVLGILIDGFFALVNFYPVGLPHKAPPRRYVLAEMNPVQAAWYQKNILDEFNQEHGTDLKLRVVPGEKMVDVLRTTHDVVLASLSQDVANAALRAGLVAAFDASVSAKQISKDLKDVRPELLRDASAKGRQYFLPRVVVLDVAVFRRSKVREALVHWRLLRADVESALREVNGRGLPSGYDLEQAPTAWDAYDLFVLAYYWAHRSYNAAPARARVAHRTGLSFEAQIDLAAGIYRAGGTDATFLLPDAQPVRDYFAWETLYRKQGLYAGEMFSHDGLDDESLLQGLAEGRFFFATVDEVEAFTLHGGGHRGAQAKVEDEGDLGFIAVPQFVSLELNRRGAPARTASDFAFRETSLWALPSGGPDPGVAYDLVRWASTLSIHVRECEALGVLPLRSDVVARQGTLFRVPWMTDIFNAGAAEWPRSQPVPSSLLSENAQGLALAQRWKLAMAALGPDQTVPDALPPDASAGTSDASLVTANAGPAGGGEFQPTPLRDRVIFHNVRGIVGDVSSSNLESGAQR